MSGIPPASTAKKFMLANDKSPVVEGFAIGDGGKGGVYTLEDGNKFHLPLEECRKLLPEYPKWKV